MFISNTLSLSIITRYHSFFNNFDCLSSYFKYIRLIIIIHCLQSKLNIKILNFFILYHTCTLILFIFQTYRKYNIYTYYKLILVFYKLYTKNKLFLSPALRKNNCNFRKCAVDVLFEYKILLISYNNNVMYQQQCSKDIRHD